MPTTDGNSIKNVWRVITIVVFAFVGSSGSDFAHFTWWSIGWLGIYGMLEEVDLGVRFFWFYMMIQIMVLFGVVIMGASECEVFEDAFEDNGPVVYIAGNFVMHYLPMLIVFGLCTTEHIFVEAEDGVRQILCAYGFFIVWHFFKDATEVYGCSLPSAIGLFGMALLTFTASICLLSLLDHKEYILDKTQTSSR